jgi:hypothetical protein
MIRHRNGLINIHALGETCSENADTLKFLGTVPKKVTPTTAVLALRHLVTTARHGEPAGVRYCPISRADEPPKK